MQGIDPATGEIRWEQQAWSGGATVAVQDGEAMSDTMVVCSIDAEQGAVSGAVVTGNSVSGEVHVDDDDNLIVIGVVTGDGFAPVGPDPGRESGAAAILTFPDGVSTAEAITVASDDAGTFLQLTDGTLVKVQTSGPDDDDDDHHEDGSHDDDEGSPESESDDD